MMRERKIRMEISGGFDKNRFQKACVEARRLTTEGLLDPTTSLERAVRKPVYVSGKQTKDFYVRVNNGTRSFDIEQAFEYITTHDWARG